jgi:hypothetical protein
MTENSVFGLLTKPSILDFEFVSYFGFLISNLFEGQRLPRVPRCLHKAVHGCLQVCLLTPGTSAWSCEALSLFKHIPAGHAAEREHHKLSLLCYCGKSDMRKMLVDFFFSNADGLGDFPGSHLFISQKGEDLLADGLRMALVSHD